MSSYGSNHSGYIHPSQYPPQPHTQQQYPPQPPYPTTPCPQPTSQPQAFYPPTPQPQPIYSSSPASYHSGGQMYSTSPTAHQSILQQVNPSRRSSSFSTTHRPPFPPYQSAPIMIPSSTQTYNSSYAPPPTSQPPIYARRPSHASHHSHHSTHMHDPHAWGDGEDKYGSGDHGPNSTAYGVLDEETLREYERRYARERAEKKALEKRPTLGDSLMSFVGKVGRTFGSERR